MTKFRKKPVVIEAYQTDKEMIIHTLEGDHKALVGDWIITGVKGEQYPCKPDIFEMTYEPVSNLISNDGEVIAEDFKYEYPIKTLNSSIAANKSLYRNKIITRGAMTLVNNQHQQAIKLLQAEVIAEGSALDLLNNQSWKDDIYHQLAATYNPYNLIEPDEIDESKVKLLLLIDK